LIRSKCGAPLASIPSKVGLSTFRFESTSPPKRDALKTIDNRPPARASGFFLLLALAAGSILLAYCLVRLVQ
jgi:hypothetical protein